MKFVLHMDSEPVSDRIDLNTYIIPPGKPFRVENDFHAEKLLEHKGPHHGLVLVNEVVNEESGQFTLDIAEAKEHATRKLVECDDAHIQNYVNTQRIDRVRTNFPPLPPEGRVADIIKRRGIDIGEDFGLHPPGMKLKGSDKQAQIDALKAQLEESAASNNALQEQMTAQSKQIEALMERMGKAEGALS